MSSTKIGRLPALVLAESRPLRLLTLLLFYFTQGFPVGSFFYAVPTWMAASGMETADVAAVVSLSALPWSLKIANGLLMDRYTFLPMGRRRAWIIGAQAAFVIALLVGAFINPSAGDVLVLSALGFAANSAVTFQDVGIDSLAVDLMPEDERAFAGGIMGGAQLVGIAAATAGGGFLLQEFGIAACLIVGAAIPCLVMLFGILIRERRGERRLPWTIGEIHSHNNKIQVTAWWPLLKGCFGAIMKPYCLFFLPILFVRSLPLGGFEAFHPVLFQESGGWELIEYTNFISTLTFFSGVFGIIVGGYFVARIGAQKALIWSLVLGIAVMMAMGFARPLWTESSVLMGFQIAMDIMLVFYFVAQIALAMRLCSPAVAAAQFAMYMAITNFGRPAGAVLAAATAGAGYPELFYWSLAATWGVALIVVLLVKFPIETEAENALAENLSPGHGSTAKID